MEDYESHLSPPEDQSPYYEPCPDCNGTGFYLETIPDHPSEDYPCESCDGQGEIKVYP